MYSRSHVRFRFSSAEVNLVSLERVISPRPSQHHRNPCVCICVRSKALLHVHLLPSARRMLAYILFFFPSFFLYTYLSLRKPLCSRAPRVCVCVQTHVPCSILTPAQRSEMLLYKDEQPRQVENALSEICSQIQTACLGKIIFPWLRRTEHKKNLGQRRCLQEELGR